MYKYLKDIRVSKGGDCRGTVDIFTSLQETCRFAEDRMHGNFIQEEQ